MMATQYPDVQCSVTAMMQGPPPAPVLPTLDDGVAVQQHKT